MLLTKPENELYSKVLVQLLALEPLCIDEPVLEHNMPLIHLLTARALPL